jgi:hypothetical protein
MLTEKLSTPILFIIFNRPDLTQLVFNEIKKAKPLFLYITADGPRKNNKSDLENCKKTREIIKQIDWECQVKTNFSEVNLGCKLGVSSGINWFFENIDEGIILEDDCLPNQSFFFFCQELLAYYRNDQRIMQIGGANFQPVQNRNDKSYYFSKYSHIWGWASWKRAWKYYDRDIKNFPDFKKEKIISNIFTEKLMQIYWLKRFEEVYNGKIDTWDFQWQYTTLIHNGLSVIPNKNLISNIGFGVNSTHTKDKNNKLANMATYNLDIITHPDFLIENKQADDYTFYYIFNSRFSKRIFKKLKRMIKIIIK